MTKLILENKLREFASESKFTYFDICAVYDRYVKDVEGVAYFDPKSLVILAGLKEKNVIE